MVTPIDEITKDVPIIKQGTSKVVVMTDVCKLLGVNVGDIVTVTIRRKKQ